MGLIDKPVAPARQDMPARMAASRREQRAQGVERMVQMYVNLSKYTNIFYIHMTFMTISNLPVTSPLRPSPQEVTLTKV